MENQETTEVVETKKKHGQIMRNVAYTFAHKKEEVKALIKENDSEIPDDANRGKWISSLMQLLRNNKEFRVSFAELMIEKKSVGQQLREKVGGRKETREERTAKVQSQKRGNEDNSFCCYNGFSSDPQILGEELRTAALGTSEAELEGYVKNSEQAKTTTNIVLVGLVIVATWLVYDKWLK